MSMKTWLVNELERQDKEKAEKLKAKGLKPYIELRPGVTTVKIDVDNAPRIEKNDFGGFDYVYTLIPGEDGTEYELRAGISLHRRITRALTPFLQLPEYKLPPFVIMDVKYDPTQPNKLRYSVEVK